MSLLPPVGPSLPMVSTGLPSLVYLKMALSVAALPAIQTKPCGRHGCHARWRPTAWSAGPPQPWMKLPSASNSMTDGAGAQHLLRGGFSVAPFSSSLSERGRCSSQTWSSRPDRDARDLAEQPVVGQRLGPERIDLELRRVGGDGGRGERDGTHQGDQAPRTHTLHRFLRRSVVRPPLPPLPSSPASRSGCRGHGSARDPCRVPRPPPWPSAR